MWAVMRAVIGAPWLCFTESLFGGEEKTERVGLGSSLDGCKYDSMLLDLDLD